MLDKKTKICYSHMSILRVGELSLLKGMDVHYKEEKNIL